MEKIKHIYETPTIFIPTGEGTYMTPNMYTWAAIFGVIGLGPLIEDYTKFVNESCIYLLLYVDDMLIAAKSKKEITTFKA
jgi:hypothetical protein